MAYIKSEPLDGDKDWHDASGSSGLSLSELAAVLAPNPGEERYVPMVDSEDSLAKRSLAVQKSKQSGSYDGLGGRVFETTGFVVNHGVVVEISHIMLDTGAAKTHISAAAAQAARLPIFNGPPTKFVLADGRKIIRRQITEFTLYMAGVHQTIRAYFEKNDTCTHLLVGMDTIKKFNGDGNFSFGRKKETRWAVAQDQTGLRKAQYLLHEDSPRATPSIYVHKNYRDGMRLAMTFGETRSQRKSREILERHEKRGRKIRQRHHHKAGPLYKGGARNTIGGYLA